MRDRSRTGPSRYPDARRPGQRRKKTVAPDPDPGPCAAWRDAEGFAGASRSPGSGSYRMHTSVQVGLRGIPPLPANALILSSREAAYRRACPELAEGMVPARPVPRYAADAATRDEGERARRRVQGDMWIQQDLTRGLARPELRYIKAPASPPGAETGGGRGGGWGALSTIRWPPAAG